ncbi:MAG TPA: aromatic ring-hydroxylating dioxygenase subunit alpha [Gemmatimonadota bacterium]|nr:aromatic ring-hydroxylating dioxygenase subunit alpha [Gemmatimonadota bacterium]
MDEGVRQLDVDEDIRRARTLPAWFYADRETFELARERVFARSWQLVADTDRVRVPGQVWPFSLLEGFLDEPLVLTRDADDRVHCLSNVCTHRANRVVDSEGFEKSLRCRYHGRRFGLDGRFQAMPEFEQAVDFPSPADDLPRVPLERWGRLLFAALDPAVGFDALTKEMAARLVWLPVEEAVFDAGRSRDYLVRAHWALYCENYLEGFHIPYIHPGLSQALDYGAYRTEIFPYACLQVGVAASGEEAFDPSPGGGGGDGADGGGERIAAYYWWLFPNTMVNVYPWGLSMNIVKPLAMDLTRVSYLTYVFDPGRLERGAGAGLDRVEREDQSIVETVQRGIRSRLYDRGRYSPTREKGVHHFHRLIARFMRSF